MGYRKLTPKEKLEEIWAGIQSMPKAKLIPALMVIGFLIYVVVGGAYGRDYHRNLDREINIARALCENSRRLVLNELERLKLGNNILREVEVNGKTQSFEYIAFPKVVFLDTGFGRIGNRAAEQDVFCTFEDPRSRKEYYYSYDKGAWADRVRLR